MAAILKIEKKESEEEMKPLGSITFPLVHQNFQRSYSNGYFTF